ncbi:MAG TPA: LysR family transcriptional regulator [Arenibaculum sp.]|nr:LysR family transcriptional regulator [Arenibaculum sp.]
MFDIRDVEIVRSVVEHGGFRAAAARLRLSQSAVSARVASLEERLGIELLDRRKRRGRLTPAGRSFLEQAVRLTEMRDRIVAALAHEAGFAGTIRIGVAETIVHTWLTQMMTAVRDRFPQLRIELSVDTSSVLADKLLQDELDFAVMMEELVPPKSVATFVYASVIDWFAAAGIDVVGRCLTVDELAKWPIVTFPKGTVPYRDVERLFVEADLAAMPLLHGCASLSTALHLVRNGFGIGVLPDSMAAADVAGGRIRRLMTSDAAKPRALRFVLCHMPSTDGTLAAALRRMAEDAVAQGAGENHSIEKTDHFDQKTID